MLDTRVVEVVLAPDEVCVEELGVDEVCVEEVELELDLDDPVVLDTCVVLPVGVVVTPDEVRVVPDGVEVVPVLGPDEVWVVLRVDDRVEDVVPD